MFFLCNILLYIRKIFSVQDKHPSCSSSPFGQSRGRGGMAVVEEGGGGGDATPTSEGESASLPHPHHHHHLHPSGAVSLSAAIQRISSQHNVSIIEKLYQRYEVHPISN
jgi:hypothetical protein